MRGRTSVADCGLGGRDASAACRIALLGLPSAFREERFDMEDEGRSGGALSLDGATLLVGAIRLSGGAVEGSVNVLISRYFLVTGVNGETNLWYVSRGSIDHKALTFDSDQETFP